MTTLYRQHQQDLLPGPFGADGGASTAAMEGAAKDALLARTKSSVYAGLVADPDGRGREAPADGLPRLGLDADIERVPGESDTAYRARVEGAWESWSWAGTEYGVMHAVGLLGLGHPAVISWRALPWDTNATRWARLRIAFRGFASWTGAPWGSWAWGARVVEPIETADPATSRKALRRVLRKWINARDRVEVVQIDRGGLLWGRFPWGGATWTTSTTTTWGPPAWGATGEAVYGAFTWGAFC